MMNKYKYYLFDLDGTISESALGIRESLENAIKSMGKPLPNLDDYTLYIGPPLLDTFRNICHFKLFRAFRIFFCPPHTEGGAGLCKIRVKSVSLV